MKGDYLGFAEFELADVVGSMHHLKILKLKDLKGQETGKCIVRLDKIDDTNKRDITMKIGVEGVPSPGIFSSRVSFLKIYKLRMTSHSLNQLQERDMNLQQSSDEWLLVQQTHHEKGKNIYFPQFVIKGSKMCNNNFDLPIKVELWKYNSGGNHKITAQTFLRINDLVTQKKRF